MSLVWVSTGVKSATSGLVIDVAKDISPYLTSMLANWQTIENKGGYISEKKHFFWLVWCVLSQWEQARRRQSHLFGSRAHSNTVITDKFSSWITFSSLNFCRERSWQSSFPIFILNCNIDCFAFSLFSLNQKIKLIKWPLMKWHQVS